MNNDPSLCAFCASAPLRLCILSTKPFNLDKHVVLVTEGHMRWILIIGAVLVGLILIIVVVGMTRPSHHVAQTRGKYNKPPADLWSVVSDYAKWSEWNPEIKSVTPLPDQNGRKMINVVGSWGTAPTALAVWNPPSKMKTEMNAGSFSGSWTYEMAPTDDGGTLLTITEEGDVGNPIFRAMMIFHDNEATMRGYHAALAKRLGGTVSVE